LFRNLGRDKVEDKGTLEGKISLYRVKDARKAFRRKYAARTNIDKIFTQCDIGDKGHIDA